MEKKLCLQIIIFLEIFFISIKDVNIFIHFLFDINLIFILLLYIIFNEIRQSYLFIAVRKNDMEIEITTFMHTLADT